MAEISTELDQPAPLRDMLTHTRFGVFFRSRMSGVRWADPENFRSGLLCRRSEESVRETRLDGGQYATT